MKKLNLSKRNYLASVFVLGGVVLVLAMLGTSPTSTMAGDPQGPKVIGPDSVVVDRDSVAYGRTYGEWDASWWQWAVSLPVTSHPLFDTADCSAGQTGPVWFLGEKFCNLNNPAACGSTITRTCSVPAGKAIYIDLASAEDSAPEEANGWGCGNLPPLLQGTIAEMRQCAESITNGYTDVSAEIDGEVVPNLMERFRVQSIVFGYTLPANNLLLAVGETGIPQGTYFPAVDEGWGLMLSPLRPGNHVVQFSGTYPLFHVTYDLTVE